MKTYDIIIYLSNNINLEEKPFKNWLSDFRKIEKDLKNTFIEEVKNMNYSEEVLKQVYKQSFKKMPFSKEHIFKNYEKNGYVLYPAKNPKQIEIICCKKDYKIFSSYWDETEIFNRETIYVFSFEKKENLIEELKNIYGDIEIYSIAGDIEGIERKSKEWDKNYVRAIYENKILDRDYIYFPAKNAKRLFVFFSSMGIDRYDRYSWYWDILENWDSDTACLFLKDDDFNYYVGTDLKPLNNTYFKIINHFISLNNLSKEQVFTIGGSMGGYGSVYYAISMELKGCIVGNLQSTRAGVQKHSFDNWRRAIKECGEQFIDLPDLVDRNYNKKLPCLYIEYSAYPADKFAAEVLIEAFKKNDSFVITNKNSGTEHNNIEYKKEHIEKAIALFEVI